MIPVRVRLSGFLSYKDEQEVRFDGSPLWMLSGTNGSGKSSIFDAVTFALFGHHRGGSQGAADLINKESATLAVEFDFTIDGHPYRVKRTVRRRTSGVASTQQVLKHVAADDWEAVPDTHLRARFDAWVRDRIGLDYETFTSSVLLLQGKSEKLLDSTPAGRAGVLARIVDLERYQKLHAKADERRRELKGRLDGLAGQLAGLRDVTDDELAAAESRIAAADGERIAVQQRIEQLDARLIEARNWADKQKTLAAARDKLAAHEGLLGHAVAIEREYARLRELRDVLPAATAIVTERGRVQESERRTEKLTRDRDAHADTRRQTEHALGQVRQKLDAHQKTLAEDEKKQAGLNARLRELAAVLEKVKHVEDAEAEAKRLEGELAGLPADPDAVVRQLTQEQERLTLLAQHVALLERLHQDRSELTKVVAEEARARAEEAKLKAEGLRAKEAFTELEAKAKAAREERAAKDQAAAEARGLARQARELADEFHTLSGAKTCRACGQDLTPAHYEDEKTKRDLAAKAAERTLAGLATAAATARKLEDELTAKEAAGRELLSRLRDQYKDAAAAVRQFGQDSKRLTDSCRQTYFALPDEFKQKLGPREPDDWAAVTYPDRHDVTELSTEAKRLDGVKRKLRAASDEAAKAQGLRARLDSARERLAKARQALPAGDPVSLRREFADKQAGETALTNQLKATKTEIAAASAEIDWQQRKLAATDRDLTELTGKLNLEEASRKQSGQTIEQLKKALPPAWQKPLEMAGLNDRARWQDELDGLVQKGTEAKFTQLQAARGGLDSLRAEIAQLEQEAAAFPEEARRSPDAVKAEVASARDELKRRDAELLDARNDKGMLDGYRRQRAELDDRYKATDAEHNRYKLLAELLGRDRLQRHLVRQAERQIVDWSNAVLDRLSGGQLFLRLVEADAGTDKALDLECANRVTGGSPINVAFLSGSQRFRVAVALALGIGQYASRQHRAVESVIIDEGFGCLDRAGRQVMIQELQNLRGHLHCILLVSHQEEFADAFPDGYRFELQNGATKVSRFVR